MDFYGEIEGFSGEGTVRVLYESDVNPMIELTPGLSNTYYGIEEGYVSISFMFSDRKDVRCEIEGDSGDADLFLMWGYEAYDGRSSTSNDSYDDCTARNDGTKNVLYVEVHAVATVSAVTVTCDY